ncbi:MAG: (2Fe-2S)-binding protein [Deltaproteobacteria bacterium RBG_16_48_10]|nr:MAG: (2Fe-2S)-binding protein [Deltaproteobacteria bacterium RBG_16_48_10]
MKKRIRFELNTKTYDVETGPGRTLLQMIREDLGLTGTKSGCERGECGACTVLLNGVAVNSCLLPAMEADGKEIVTIEGLARNGRLHPLQEKFIELGAIQCGFCTPGMILTAKALLDRNIHPTEREVRREIAGNFCRCTGYDKIVEAILAAFG